MKSKKVLLLLNNAPDVKKYYNQLYYSLKEINYTPVIFAESNFYQYVMKIDYPIDYTFSNYYKECVKTKQFSLKYPALENINIWDSFFSDFDRNQYLKNLNLKTIEQKLNCLYNLVYEIILNEKIDIIFNEPVSNVFNHAAYNVGQALNVKYLGFVYSRLPKYYEFYETIFPNALLYKDNFEKLQNGQIKLSEAEQNYIHNYLSNFDNLQPDYMKVNGLGVKVKLLSTYLNRTKVQYLFGSLKYVVKEHSKDIKYNLQIGNPLISSYNTVLRNIKRKFKLRFKVKKYYTADVNLEAITFFLYPLHFHPESSTSIWAKHFVDEINTIKNIAFNLPNGTYLVVKDHPSAAGFPGIKFYRELSKIPNVFLMNHNINTKKLISLSAGVITLTSTVGFEALILNKPVVTIGEIFYNTHPLCHKINSFYDLYHICSSITSNSKLQKIDPKLTVSAYLKMCTIADDLIHKIVSTKIKFY